MLLIFILARRKGFWKVLKLPMTGGGTVSYAETILFYIRRGLFETLEIVTRTVFVSLECIFFFCNVKHCEAGPERYGFKIEQTYDQRVIKDKHAFMSWTTDRRTKQILATDFLY